MRPPLLALASSQNHRLSRWFYLGQAEEKEPSPAPFLFLPFLLPKLEAPLALRLPRLPPGASGLPTGLRGGQTTRCVFIFA